MFYENEREFKNKFMRFLERQGCTVYNVESHSVPGIPDLYVLHDRFGDLWIELKNAKHSKFDGYCADIDYRPGQIAWQHRYLEAHMYRRCCLTVVAYRDGCRIVPGVHISNTVEVSYDTLFVDNFPGIRMLDVASRLPDSDAKTMREFFVDCVQQVFGDDWDFDTDVLWEELLPGWNIDDTPMNYKHKWKVHNCVLGHWK